MTDPGVGSGALLGFARVGDTDGRKNRLKRSATSDALLLRGTKHHITSFLKALRISLPARITLGAFFRSYTSLHTLQITSDLLSQAANRDQPSLLIAAQVRITFFLQPQRDSRLPNVKDEPRRGLARGVRQHDP